MHEILLLQLLLLFNCLTAAAAAAAKTTATTPTTRRGPKTMEAVLATSAESACPARWFIWVIYGALIESAALGKVAHSSAFPPPSPLHLPLLMLWL